MKTPAMLTFMVALALGGGSTFAADRMDDMRGTGKPAVTGDKTHRAIGVVKALDARSGGVVLDHEPVKSVNWPAMRMSFAVKEKMLFDRLVEGRTVEFEFVQDGKAYVVTDVK